LATLFLVCFTVAVWRSRARINDEDPAPEI
jgi:hypothetical protein